MPPGEVRARDVTDLAARDQRVESFENFLDGSKRVESVHVIDVEVVGIESFETRFAGLDQMMAR